MIAKARAKSISAAKLTTLTKAAVKDATGGVKGTFLGGKGPTMGFVLQAGLSGAEQLNLAATITDGLAANAREAGITGLKAQPVVVFRPEKIIVGFIKPELNLIVR